MIEDEKLNEMNKERQNLIRSIDKEKDLDKKKEMKKELKNLNERVRYHTKKIESEIKIDEPIIKKIIKKKKKTIKSQVIEIYPEFLKQDKKSAIQNTANKIGTSKTNVAWYVSKLGLKK